MGLNIMKLAYTFFIVHLKVWFLVFLFQTASQSGSLIGPEACPRIELEGTSDGKLLVPSGTRMKIPVKAIHLKVSESIVATLTITSQLWYLYFTHGHQIQLLHSIHQLD